MHAGYNYKSIMPTVNARVCVCVGKTNAAKTTARLQQTDISSKISICIRYIK